MVANSTSASYSPPEQSTVRPPQVLQTQAFLIRHCHCKGVHCADRLIGAARDLELVEGDTVAAGVVHNEHLRHRHLVGRQRASLVGADDRRAAERLDRWQRAHNSVLLRHTACAYIEYYVLSVSKQVNVPKARQVVITAGRPSGMAATASATAILK